MKRLLFCLWGIIVPLVVYSSSETIHTYNDTIIVSEGTWLTAPNGNVLPEYYNHERVSNIWDYYWKVSDTSIISIEYGTSDSRRKIVGKKAGKCQVTVTYKIRTIIGGAGVSSFKDYNIKDIHEITVIDLTSITIPNTLIMEEGRWNLISPIYNDSKLNPQLTWYSSNPSVATVSSDLSYDNGKSRWKGIVTTNDIGYTTISCTASNGVTSNKCEVFVYSMSLEPVYEVGLWETLKLTPIITPSSSYTINPYVTWRSTDGEIAKVDKDGIVTPINIGQCKIIMTSGYSQKDTCIVKVLDNYLSIDSAIGVPSGTLVLPIRLNNTSNITGMQFELQLPDGVSVAQDKLGNLLASLSDRADDQMITGSRLTNGNYQFVVFSKNSKPLLGNEGAIAYVTLKISPDMAIGDYTIGMRNIELTTPTGKAIYNMDKSAKLTIDDVKMGDVNGDGRVTVTDAVCIVNYIHERYPSVFIDKAADVNGDGLITITDAVGIINMIQNQ